MQIKLTDSQCTWDFGSPLHPKHYTAKWVHWWFPTANNSSNHFIPFQSLEVSAEVDFSLQCEKVLHCQGFLSDPSMHQSHHSHILTCKTSHIIARVFFHFSLKLKTILFALTWWGFGRHSHLSTARWRTRRAALWWSAPASIDPACSYLGMPSSPALTASKIKPRKNTSHKLLAKDHAAF